MRKANRAIAVLVLVAAVMTVLALKNRNQETEPGPLAPAPGATAAMTANGTPAPGALDALKEDAPTAALPRLVDLGAGKCIPCKMMAPILEELRKQYAGTFEVEFIDVWKSPEAGEQYGIRIIPTQIFYDAAGKELFRHEGFFGKEDILATWAKHGVAPSSGDGE